MVLSCETAGAEIRYTTDGSNPTTGSTKYTAPIPVTQAMTIKAKAYCSGSGYTPSQVMEAAYEVEGA